MQEEVPRHPAVAISDNVEFIAAHRIKHKYTDQLEDIRHKLADMDALEKQQRATIDQYFASLTKAIEDRKLVLLGELEKQALSIKNKLEDNRVTLSANLEVCTELIDAASQLYPASQEAAEEGLKPIQTLPSVKVIIPVFKTVVGKSRKKSSSNAHPHHHSSHSQPNLLAHQSQSQPNPQHAHHARSHSQSNSHAHTQHQSHSDSPHEDEGGPSLLGEIEREGEIVAGVLKYQVGQMTSLAGSGHEGHKDGKGEEASFISPLFVALNPLDGHAYVSDSSNHKIRRISPQGVVTTFAGRGCAGFEDGPGSGAKFNYPRGLCFNHKTGDLYVCDYSNNRIRKVSPSGVVSTVAGAGTEGCKDGDAMESTFSSPTCIDINQRDGSLYVSDHFNHCIRKILDGKVLTLAGSEDGFADGNAKEAKFSFPFGVAVHPANGDVYVADYGNDRVRKISHGKVTTVVGTEETEHGTGGGPVDSFHAPYDVRFRTQDSSLLVAEYSANRIRTVSQSGVVGTIAWLTEEGRVSTYVSQPASLDVDQEHHLCYVASNGHRVYVMSFP